MGQLGPRGPKASIRRRSPEPNPVDKSRWFALAAAAKDSPAGDAAPIPSLQL
jgi:hypothetical protein